MGREACDSSDSHCWHYDKSNDYIVWDARNGHVIPAIGVGDDPANCVYTKSGAEAMAKQLNDYVLRNTLPALVGVIKSSEGPFYARPASMRDKLEGRGVG